MKIEKIKQIMKDKKINQEILSRETGISYSYISQLMTGFKDNPTIETVRKIAEALEVDPHEIISFENNQSECGTGDGE
jgi:DNA-binding Xre family transcriptional regulator